RHFLRRLVGAEEVAGIEVEAECRLTDLVHQPQPGGRIVDRLADVRFYGQLDAGFSSEPRQVADPLDRFSRGSLVARLAAGADVYDRHPQLPREPEQPSKPLAI